MKSLLYKDLLLLRNYRKSILIMILFGIIALLSGNSNGGGMEIYIVLYSALYLIFSLSFSSLYYDGSSKFVEYVDILPISKKTYVKSKYYFAGKIYFFELILMIALGRFLFNFENLSVYITIIAAQTIKGSILIDVFFKYGADKMRIMISSIFIITLILLLLLLKLGAGLISIFLISIDYMKIFPWILLIISILIYILFMEKTVRMEEKKW